MHKRKLLAAGLTLSINYAVLLVASFCLMVVALAYTMLDTVEIANDLLDAILKPFETGDNTTTIIYIGAMIVAFVYLLVCATRVSKFSRYTPAMFQSKKFALILFLVSFVVAIGGYAYWLIQNLKHGFSGELILNIVLIFTLSIHLICIVLMIIEYIKGFTMSPVKEEDDTNSQLSSYRPPIYTAGLDETETVKEEVVKQKGPQKPKVELKESDLSKKLVDSIGKLDQMRKDGSISTTEYTKLRAQIIKNLTKQS